MGVICYLCPGSLQETLYSKHSSHGTRSSLLAAHAPPKKKLPQQIQAVCQKHLTCLALKWRCLQIWDPPFKNVSSCSKQPLNLKMYISRSSNFWVEHAHLPSRTKSIQPTLLILPFPGDTYMILHVHGILENTFHNSSELTSQIGQEWATHVLIGSLSNSKRHPWEMNNLWEWQPKSLRNNWGFSGLLAIGWCKTVS